MELVPKISVQASPTRCLNVFKVLHKEKNHQVKILVLFEKRTKYSWPLNTAGVGAPPHTLGHSQKSVCNFRLPQNLTADQNPQRSQLTDLYLVYTLYSYSKVNQRKKNLLLRKIHVQYLQKNVSARVPTEALTGGAIPPSCPPAASARRQPCRPRSPPWTASGSEWNWPEMRQRQELKTSATIQFLSPYFGYIFKKGTFL